MECVHKTKQMMILLPLFSLRISLNYLFRFSFIFTYFLLFTNVTRGHAMLFIIILLQLRTSEGKQQTNDISPIVSLLSRQFHRRLFNFYALLCHSWVNEFERFECDVFSIFNLQAAATSPLLQINVCNGKKREMSSLLVNETWCKTTSRLRQIVV